MEECQTVMLVGAVDQWEPGLTPVPSTFLEEYKDTNFSTVFIVTPETGLDDSNRLQTVNIEGLRVGS